MRRREFIFGAAATLGCVAGAWPVMGRAQQGKNWRIGVLIPGFLTGPTHNLLEVLRHQLDDLGYIEGKNLIIDRRAAEGRNDRLPAFANALIAFHPDVIVRCGTPTVAASQRATSNISIGMK